MDRLMKRVTAGCAIALAIVVVGQWRMPSKGLLALAITLLIVVYQLGMRLFVGNVIEQWFPKQFNVQQGWFKVQPGEMRLYQWLRVKQWKKHLPTYEPEKYDVRKHSIAEIIQTMCCAELDHEIMLVLSYLPVILIYWFGDPVVFAITSVSASLVELPFIVLQRFNRVRLVRIWERKGKK